MDVRIPPAPSSELGPLARLVAAGAGWIAHTEPPRVFTTLGRNRRLFRCWLPFAGSLLLRGRLPRHDVEVVVLRTACNCTSAYEWVQHVPLAAKAGVPAGEIACVPDWRAHDGFTDRQRVLLAATDELHGAHVIGGSTWQQLVAALRTDEIIELCMLVGHYEMVAMTLNSLGVEPEPEALAALDAPALEQADRLQAALASLAGDPAPALI